MKSIFNNKKIMIIISIIIIGMIAMIVGDTNVFFAAKETINEVSINKKKVQTTKVVESDIKQVLNINGYTQDGHIDIGYTEIQGKVQKIYVRENDSLSKGDILFKIDTTGNIAQLQLQLSELELKETELALLIDQLRIQKEKISMLFDAGAVSENELTLIKNQEAQLINQRGQIAEQAAETRVKISELDALGTIVSPNNGIVSKVEMKEGTYLTEKDYIRVEKSEKPRCEFYLTEESINFIEKDMEVNINIPSLDLDVKGLVSEILPGGGKDYLYPVKVELQTEENIKGGLITNMEIVVYENKKALLIPTKSFIEFNNEVYVYILDKNSIARKRAVKKGASEKGMTEIVEGLSREERVISNGHFMIADGEEVEY